MPSNIAQPAGLKPPSRVAQLGELALPLDMIGFGFGGWRLIGAPRGDGRPVVVLPGYGASEISMRPLEYYLTHLGYTVRDWGLGRNLGRVYNDVERFAEHAAGWVTEADGARLTLIGWSLGGVIARETARLHPKLVREVITMGTPLIGGPKYTSVGARYAKSNQIDLDAFERDVHRRNSIGIDQPLTVIYTERDGVVGPDIAVDIYNPRARNIKVDGGHLGLGINPKVWRIIADTLAAS